MIKKYNIIMILIYIALLAIPNVLKLNLEWTIFIFFFAYILYIIYGFISLKSIKKVILSPEIIFESVFFMYSVMAAIMFVIDGYSPRVDFFRIDYDTIYRTLMLYYNINIIFLIITLVKNGPEAYECNDKIQEYAKKSNSTISIWDIICLAVTVYFLYLNFRNGISILSMNNRVLRTLIYSKANTYIYLYMIIYCSIRYSEIIYANGITKKNILIILITLPFWAVSILTDRRNIINLIIVIIMVLFSKYKKIKIKSIIKIALIFLAFLSMGYFRANTSFSKERIRELFYMSNGEFILSHYVSEYYINQDNQLYYGKTYFVDPITKFIPRVIYKNKPIDLSEKFYNDAKTNVGFAFNPVAEGIINFGVIGSILFVPFTIYFYVWLAKKIYIKNVFGYLIVCGYSINIFRGFFANSIFAIVFMYIIVYLMTNKKVRRE